MRGWARRWEDVHDVRFLLWLTDAATGCRNPAGHRHTRQPSGTQQQRPPRQATNPHRHALPHPSHRSSERPQLPKRFRRRYQAVGRRR